MNHDAAPEQIVRAWRGLVLVHHPDKQYASSASVRDGPEGDKVDIRLVNEAKWVLSDPTRRKEWEEAFFNG